jgi:hypothetical protein
MKFDNLANNIISEMLEEGRTAKNLKYANISIDSDKMLEKLNSGDFDVIVNSWSGSPRYANLSEDSIKQLLSSVVEGIKTRNPSDFDELRNAVNMSVDSVYQNKGDRRKTYTDRMTKAVVNLILHDEYNLVVPGENTSDMPEEEEGESEEMTSLESAIYEFVKQSDVETSLSDVEAQFNDSKEVVDSLIKKGLLKKEGNTLSVIEDDGSFTPTLEIDDADSEFEDPLEADQDIKSTFKNSFKDTFDDDRNNDLDSDRDYRPYWDK